MGKIQVFPVMGREFREFKEFAKTNTWGWDLGNLGNLKKPTHAAGI